jgi:hypothetical protein
VGGGSGLAPASSSGLHITFQPASICMPAAVPPALASPSTRVPPAPAGACAGWYAEANQSKVFMMALDPEEPANYADNKNGHRLLNLNTGFMVIRKSPAALEMLQLWADETEAHPEWNHKMYWDQCAAALLHAGCTLPAAAAAAAAGLCGEPLRLVGSPGPRRLAPRSAPRAGPCSTRTSGRR